MSKTIHFLGWDQPVTDTVARYILNDAIPPLARMDGTLIVVPTKEAGRRLREKMMIICRENKSALLDARMVTPSFLIQPHENAGEEANETLVRSVLIKTLLGLRQDDCPTLFPRGIPQDNLPWAFATAKIIQQLRDDLSDGCLSINSVIEKHAANLSELQRWQDLGKIEKLYLENLKKTGRLDPGALKLANLVSPAIPAGINKIIIASVPDPALLVLAALGELAKKIKIEVLVMAPEELKDHFDDWGRPLPDKWRERFIDIPAPKENIRIAGNPAGQAQFVLDLIRESEYQPADICIGVPDRAVIPYLQDKLESAGLAAFDPADRPVKDHHLYHLVKAWCQLADNPSFANIAAFLRNADILNYLQAAITINAFELLSELDQLQNKALPQTMRDVELALKKTADFPSLKTAIKSTNEIIASANTRLAHEALRFFLEQVFALKTITDDSDDDKDFKTVAFHVSEILNWITYARTYLKEFPPRLIYQLISSSLDELSIPRHREGAMLDLNGWLELAWNDAPFMVITGFNEGQVPDSRKSDMFLPDSLKKNLGLRNNATRFARDAYLLALILATREAPRGKPRGIFAEPCEAQNAILSCHSSFGATKDSPYGKPQGFLAKKGAQLGRVILIAGKTSPEDEPLKPSRLLFRCPNEQLAERAESIFKEVEAEIHNPPFSVTFKLNPAAPLPARSAMHSIAGGAIRQPPVLPAELHVTQFRDYLACPFRFYLKHILKMERTEFKAELDALDFGTAIHAILEKFSGNPKIKNSIDPDAIQKYLNSMLDRYFEGVYGTNDSFPIRYAREIARQRLKAFAGHQAQSASDGWEIVERELACQLTIAGVKVAGMIDRIDKNRNDGKIRIIDYKTSDSAENPEKTHIKESRKEIADYAGLQAGGNKQWLDLQMPLYWHMFKNTGLAEKYKKVELCYFNLPRAITNSRIEAWEDFNESLAESAYKSAEKIIECIKRGIFWPPADSVKYDDYEALFAEDMCNYFDGDMLEAFMKEHWRK